MNNNEYINRLEAINTRLEEVIYLYKKICHKQNPVGIVLEPALRTLLYIRDGEKKNSDELLNIKDEKE